MNTNIILIMMIGMPLWGIYFILLRFICLREKND